jgi:hypothetical protein
VRLLDLDRVGDAVLGLEIAAKPPDRAAPVGNAPGDDAVRLGRQLVAQNEVVPGLRNRRGNAPARTAFGSGGAGGGVSEPTCREHAGSSLSGLRATDSLVSAGTSFG